MSHIPPNYPPKYESPSLTVQLQRAYADSRQLREKLLRTKNSLANLRKGLNAYHRVYHMSKVHGLLEGGPEEQRLMCKACDMWAELMAGLDRHIATGTEMDFRITTWGQAGTGPYKIIEGSPPLATGVASPARLPSIAEQPRTLGKVAPEQAGTDAFKDTLVVALNNHPLS